ncbi:hypothetical protein PSD17_09460 [Pseudonocardia sp. D17]|nr:hypothetical protein PSD17_09460 [Pseudonocardia sp. D17]
MAPAGHVHGGIVRRAGVRESLYDPDVALNENDLGRTDGLPPTEEQRDELVARQRRLDEARAAVDAAQRERDAYLIELDDAGVATTELARALGLHRANVEHVLTDHRKTEVAQRLAEEAPRAATQAALDRAQARVDQAWEEPSE